MTVMGDALMDGLSDAGSTPARSTKKVPIFRYFFYLVSIHAVLVFRCNLLKMAG